MQGSGRAACFVRDCRSSGEGGGAGGGRSKCNSSCNFCLVLWNTILNVELQTQIYGPVGSMKAGGEFHRARSNSLKPDSLSRRSGGS